MALIKDFTTVFGCVANYWRVTDFKADSTINNVKVVISLYFSKDARINGDAPFENRVYNFSMMDMNNELYINKDIYNDSPFNNIKKYLYDTLKSYPEFTGAQDDI